MEDLKELQKELDEKKWLDSENTKKDLTGKMPYCNYCPFQDNYLKICSATEQFVIDASQCARMEIIRKQNEKAKSYALFDITKE